MLALVMINVAEVFFITKTLHSSALMYGLVSTSFGVGNIVGAVASSRLKQGDASLAGSTLLSTLVVSVMVGAIGLVEHVGYIFPLLIVIGIAVGVLNVAFNTLMTLRTPEAQRGRMFASAGAVFTSAQIGGTALGGLILTIVAPRTVFQIAGIATTVVLLVVGPFAYRASRSAIQLETNVQGD